MSFSAQAGPSMSQSLAGVKQYNDVELTHDYLLMVLNDLSSRILQFFGRRVKLVVHGGAVMVLHPRLKASRKSTRDVDYNHRSFVAEYQRRGVPDADARLKKCIADTAACFHLGADWMNACADVALPMARDKEGNLYDPIYADAMTATNIAINTIYNSPGLVLIGVSWSWAVALKLVRYQKHDPEDIAHILRLGRRQRGVQWTRYLLESWLVGSCRPMRYEAYPTWQMEQTRNKMRHAIKLEARVPEVRVS